VTEETRQKRQPSEGEEAAAQDVRDLLAAEGLSPSREESRLLVPLLRAARANADRLRNAAAEATP
jgi:hypothetical protein